MTVLDVARRREGQAAWCSRPRRSAYGETPDLPKHEDMTPMPLSPYAVHEARVRAVPARSSRSIYGLETVNLRYFNVFGPSQTPDGAYAAAIPRFI